MGSRDANIARSREALSYFHNQASQYSGYNLTFNQLLDRVGGGGAKTSIFLDGFGFTIEQVGLSTSKLKTAMENLADDGHGQLPELQSSWFSALSSEAQHINWVAAIPEIAVGVAGDVAKGFAEGGESVIGVLKSMNVIIPILVIGGFVFIAVMKIKKEAA